jgi:hypothetical protein
LSRSPIARFPIQSPAKLADMNRVDATMAIKFAVLGMLFTPLVMLVSAMGIGRLKIFLVRGAASHNRSH